MQYRDQGHGGSLTQHSRWVPRLAGRLSSGPGQHRNTRAMWTLHATGAGVPVFAFFASEVTIGGPGGLPPRCSIRSPWVIVAGVVLGKTFGVLGATSPSPGSPRPNSTSPCAGWST